MLVVRPIAFHDEEAFIRFAFLATFGMTSLPKNEQLLREKIRHSYDSFTNRQLEPWEQIYIFVLEDLERKTIEGISAIIPHTGHRDVEYYYRLHTTQTHASRPKVPGEFQLLKTISYAQGPTEIGSLYLEPQYRKGGLGRLLSLTRFLYIAGRRNAFEDVIISRLRGVITPEFSSPFWEGLGSFFYRVSFQEIIQEVSIDKSFIHQIVPQSPIYAQFLSQETQKVIGQIDLISKPAYNMLINEGFAFTQDIDILDGGPKVACPADSIRTVKKSVVAHVGEIIKDMSQENAPYILSNNRIGMDFRTCFAAITIKEQKIVLSAEIAEGLYIKKGDEIRYITREPS